MSARLLLHERTLTSGERERTWLEREGDMLHFHVEGETKVEVPLAIFDGVMRRYGRPLAENVAAEDAINAGPRLEVGGGRTIAVFRYRPRYDVIAKDYLVYAREGSVPVAELATAVTAALAYLLGFRAREGDLGGSGSD